MNWNFWTINTRRTNLWKLYSGSARSHLLQLQVFKMQTVYPAVIKVLDTNILTGYWWWSTYNNLGILKIFPKISNLSLYHMIWESHRRAKWTKFWNGWGGGAVVQHTWRIFFLVVFNAILKSCGALNANSSTILKNEKLQISCERLIC